MSDGSFLRFRARGKVSLQHSAVLLSTRRHMFSTGEESLRESVHFHIGIEPRC